MRRSDAVAGVVLGVQSVPDGLATGLLAGVSPVAGLNAYMVGTAAGALATSSVFMTVQGTGAMAMVIADVPALRDAQDPTRALVTLSVLTGVVMLVAGLLRGGSILRFVSNAVLVGFINAVGINIILGQLANFTGYAAEGGNRLVRTFNTIVHPGRLDGRSLLIGVATIAMIVLLERTRLGGLGLVVAVIASSAFVKVTGWTDVATLRDLGVAVESLPRPELPLLQLVPELILPAISLAFVGLVQGAAISANFPQPDGSYPDASRDFVGQGVANLASGVLRGMPVGASMSATVLNKSAGARSRWSLLIAAAVMAIIVVAFGGAVGYVAMPSLAGLLMLIGFRTVRPTDLRSVWRTGLVQKSVMGVTFILVMLIPLQYAVLVGVGVSVVLHVVRQSNQVSIRRQVLDDDGHFVEVDPPTKLPDGEVVVLQPYGSLFFAAAPTFESKLPMVGSDSARSVVILRLRGRCDLGTTFMDVLHRYAQSLLDAGSKLMIVSANDRIIEQLSTTGITDLLGADDIYPGEERVGATVRRAHADAQEWIRTHR